MENKQKRKLFTLIYKTITLFTIIAIGCVIYLSIDKLMDKTNSVMWLDITLLSVCGLLLIYILADFITTRKLKNKYGIAKFYYVLFVLSFLGLITLGIYCYIQKVDVLNYVSYALPLGLVFMTEIVLIINFVIGMMISRLHRNTTIMVDSVSDTPNFDDEVVMKKKLDELNRKLSMKKIQEEIDRVEKELDK